MSRLRVAAALVTVVVAFFVSIGACSPVSDPGPYTAPPAVLQARYVLTGASMPVLVEDAQGDPIRVYADTLYFTGSTYIEAAKIGRFVGFPSENITTVRSAPTAFTTTPGQANSGSNNITLPGMIGGTATGTYYSNTYLSLTTHVAATNKSWFWSFQAK